MAHRKISIAAGGMQFRPFSIRSLLVLTTVVAAVLAVHSHRRERERRLLEFVERHNALLDWGRWDEAREVTESAVNGFPDHPAAQYMAHQDRFIAGVMSDDGGCVYGFDDALDEDSRLTRETPVWNCLKRLK